MNNNELEISVEVFPPNENDKIKELISLIKMLYKKINITFCSITFGAGGSNKKNTLDVIKMIKQNNIECVPHLSCISNNKPEIIKLINIYKKVGIKKILALRGDINKTYKKNHFINSLDLIKLINKNFYKNFEIIVSAYPEMHPNTINFEKEVFFIIKKFCLGAHKAITQYFYDPDAYFYFLEKVSKYGVDQPIIPGIMPIINLQKLINFSNKCGANIPKWIYKQLEACKNKNEIEIIGKEIVIKLCEILIKGGAPGLHFYTLNKIEPTLNILNELIT
ncbi:5,10-methylenetetrahydrofolate reductase [Candidatus Portiera aleyrodidarum]|uniref:Methylenetetrahydrofolate reductase n=1 Tax=Candidatus Portiera aleyrodidarum TV TaxID=1297582 RepID=A0A8D3X728_9GAMM|nr:methylenetetrahydrofolate reductase [Candidatus Portiera aleyrodidarum]AGI27196.1 5,10-methylenetetrahydrofolate reductase [Candidatus Portiera aleyrodidarum TV]CEI59181.1 5,10-methylenetetrahydrofolate reductase [Candidatus Portiera aleyrodidarum]